MNFEQKIREPSIQILGKKNSKQRKQQEQKLNSYSRNPSRRLVDWIYSIHLYRILGMTCIVIVSYLSFDTERKLEIF